MKISEVASLSGLTTSRIRFYEQQGLIANPQRAANGYRDYQNNVLANLQLIKLGQSLGFTLEEIKPFLGIASKVDHQDALTFLQQKQQHMQQLIEELIQKQQALDKLVSMLSDRKVDDACIEPKQIMTVLADTPTKSDEINKIIDKPWLDVRKI
ncbi:MerR family transcriptional regulator [Shewanella aestuarii]|uniref:MerR family transcriptional regulator n=1 Tax=Shewanella aestuarii TaxID=1028752 RepID=A0A6G9QIB9_9GAMM|nr:MerR family transcriptional regulator [Shewanella aestuarii]QIR14246.1 MerR family transcriptional regulator [Shewanella aestuarii]